MNILSGSSSDMEVLSYNSRRVKHVMEPLNMYFGKTITLPGVAKAASMSETAFKRFFKTRTGVHL